MATLTTLNRTPGRGGGNGPRVTQHTPSPMSYVSQLHACRALIVPGISPTAWPLLPKPAMSTSSFSSMKLRHPSRGTKAVIFLPFLISCTRMHLRIAELGCLASTPLEGRGSSGTTLDSLSNVGVHAWMHVHMHTHTQHITRMQTHTFTTTTPHAHTRHANTHGPPTLSPRRCLWHVRLPRRGWPSCGLSYEPFCSPLSATSARVGCCASCAPCAAP